MSDKANKPADQQQSGPPSQEEAAKAIHGFSDSTAAGEGEETFGHGENKYPLSFFDGKSDEEVLATPGIGEATLADIKKAQKKRDKA